MRKMLVGMMLFMFLPMLSACSDEPTPESRFSEYIKLWNEENFQQMYDYLTADAKKTISQDEFINRYSKIYKDLKIHKLDVQYEQPKKVKKTKEATKKLSFTVKMETLAGPIAFEQKATLVKETRKAKAKSDESNEANESWYVDWSTAMIFPELEETDSISVTTTRASRGEIYDRYGDPLALNGTAFEIGIVPERMDNTTVGQLASMLNIQQDRIEKALDADWVQPHYFVPVATIAETQTVLLQQLYTIPGVTKQDVVARIYPFGEAAAHLIGYTGPITAEELKTLAAEGYTATDTIGKRGLEQVLDKRLRGENGYKIFIKKQDGTEIVLAEKAAVKAKDLALTIDATLQQQVFDELKGEAGTATAIDPLSGETLALVSAPSFDPNRMAFGISSAGLAALENDVRLPLLNRFKSTFVPGSIIKPITAAIGLDEGTLAADEQVDIEGQTWQKDSGWGEYRVTRVVDPFAPVDLEKALVYSDNIYFAQAALKLGKNKFAGGLKRFGFEEEVPFLYPIETSTFGKLDSERLVADTGYGQGQIEVSVVHIAAAYTSLLNDGNIIKPILLEDEDKGQVWKKEAMTAEHAESISERLEKVAESLMGKVAVASGREADLGIAGKTGTAELKSNLGEEGTQFGWFVGYKTDSPNLLIAMMIENVEGRGGSQYTFQKVHNLFKK